MKTSQRKNQESDNVFTYGDQFNPEKIKLVEIIELCKENEPNRNKLEADIFEKYFSHKSRGVDNDKKMAMNSFLTLRAYGLIADIADNKVSVSTTSSNSKKYRLTKLSNLILDTYKKGEDIHKLFAKHILTRLTGMSLLKSIEAIITRGDKPTVELIGYELQEIGYTLPVNCTYPSTMMKWLSLAKVINKYDIDWDIVYELIGANQDYIDELYSLTSEQKYFLTSMVQLDISDFTPWNKITQYTKNRYQIRLPSKTFVKEVITPLENLNLLSSRKATTGRGAKPHEVKLTEKARNQLVGNLVETISKLTDITSKELNKSFEEVLVDLENSDKHIKGKALELLAIWLIRLTSLRFTKWRLRSFDSTGGGEVDVLAGSDKFVYSRWQIQCKNTNTVTVDVLAKEIGMTFVTGADVVMVVTTGEFTREAFNYASRMMEVSRYYMILIQKEDIESIKENKTNIIRILDKQARRVFAKKELLQTDEQIDKLEREGEVLRDSYEQLIIEESCDEE